MIKQISIVTGFIAISLGACHQKSEIVPASAVVTINMLSPAEGQVYQAGDTVWMRADVSYSTQMHGYALTVEDTSDSNIFYDEEEHVHNDHFSINSYWVATSATPNILQVKLAVAASHEAAPTIVYRTIHIQ